MTDEYPECERWAKIHSNVLVIKEFLDFVNYTTKPKVALCEFYLTNSDSGEWYMIGGAKIDDLLYKFFDIDPIKLENERRAMLDKLREMNEKKD
jgi:hypothetical protein